MGTRQERPDEPTAEDALACIIEAILALPSDAGQPDFTLGHRSEYAGGGWYWEISYRTVVSSGKQLAHGLNQRKAFVDAARYYLEAVDRDRGLMPGDGEDGD